MSAEQAVLVGQEGKTESYYFPPQHNNVGNNFPYTFFGLNSGTTKEQVRQCIADWNKGDNGILDLDFKSNHCLEPIPVADIAAEG